MSWSAILALLMDLLIAELPGVVAAIAEWVKGWLARRTITAADASDTLGPPTGTLEEFAAAVRQRFNDLIDRAPVGVRFMLRVLNRQLTGELLAKLYDLVVGKAALPARAKAAEGTAPPSVSEVLDELAKCDE